MTGTVRLFSILLALALLMVMVPACGNDSPTPTPSSSTASGVQGKALIDGGPAPGSPRPQGGVTVAVHEGTLDGPVVAESRAGMDGSFRFELPPGTYTLIEVSDAAFPETVVVQPGQFADVTLYIHAR